MLAQIHDFAEMDSNGAIVNSYKINTKLIKRLQNSYGTPIKLI